MSIPPLPPPSRLIVPGGSPPELLDLPRATHRPDGWPLCPGCGADELADNDMHARTAEGGPAARARSHAELTCYACHWRGHVPSTAPRPWTASWLDSLGVAWTLDPTGAVLEPDALPPDRGALPVAISIWAGERFEEIKALLPTAPEHFKVYLTSQPAMPPALQDA